MTDVERVADYIHRFSELIGVPINRLEKEGCKEVGRGSVGRDGRRKRASRITS
jgi:hypothetical protein